ncbi:MAG TPA: alpha/beta fold hydrolase [Vulgatibacter sp.]|nr:alpha/beta fold hydrolase [Vulgatibacter sp.]
MAAHPTDPFELGRGPDAVLMLHGFSGSPFELRPLAYQLAGRGFRCRVPLLPGHGPSADLAATTEADWLAGAEDALSSLRRETTGRLFLVGFSMGATLAIRLAAAEGANLSGLVLLAPALALKGPSAVFRALFRHRLASALWTYVDKGPGDLLDRSISMPALPPIATRAAASLDRAIVAAREALPRVQVPTLVLWGARDRVVPRRAAEEAAAQVGSGPAPLVVLPHSAHQLALDTDRELVGKLVIAFFERLSTGREALAQGGTG